MSQDLSAGFWRPKLDRVSECLRVVHKLLIDQSKHEYERTRGPIKGPYALFALVAQDPHFAWLQPMTRLMVDVDDLLDRKDQPLAKADMDEVRRRFEALLAARTEPFSIRYLDFVHSSPDVAAEHGRLRAALHALAVSPGA